ncbi:queuosine precursor transporter [Cucumibacter marinus]|uniref:queuosine precursor transporter n=1 Tax=Cucumibacter marinus TaxID=1121252 RepID=UPI0004222767|nr:queuosine precursor transporter [Cucumibacter marinus]
MLTRLIVAFVAMVAVVATSNFLVQFQVEASLGPVDLAQILTWGAFTYPAAFLVTDLTNRHFGPRLARIVVLAGFIVAVAMSIWLATPRIAIASGSAFIVAQMLDVSIFNWLRQGRWWRAPLASSLIGSVIDTTIFFSLAFAPFFAGIDSTLGLEDSSLGFGVPFLSVGAEVPLWISLAVGDFLVKLLMAAILLAPYGALRRRIPEGAPA